MNQCLVCGSQSTRGSDGQPPGKAEVALQAPDPMKLFMPTGDVSAVPPGLNTCRVRFSACTIAVPAELEPAAIPSSGGVTSKPTTDSFAAAAWPSKPTA